MSQNNIVNDQRASLHVRFLRCEKKNFHFHHSEKISVLNQRFQEAFDCFFFLCLQRSSSFNLLNKIDDWITRYQHWKLNGSLVDTLKRFAKIWFDWKKHKTRNKTSDIFVRDSHVHRVLFVNKSIKNGSKTDRQTDGQLCLIFFLMFYQKKKSK